MSLRDLGISAFRSDNSETGALAAFVEACTTGFVPSGSYLVLESLDRLSRDKIRPALRLFLQLQDHGITIVTHEPEREYDPGATDALSLIEPLIIFARAHEESVMKSSRRKDGWTQARAKARRGDGPMMRTCPAWLEVTDTGFRIKEEAAQAVQHIFDMARDGLGVHRITRMLAEENVPPIGDGDRWVTSCVYHILRSPAAMGTYQPHKQEGKHVVPDGEPILEYYPAIITEQDWREAQTAIASRGNGRGAGRKGKDEGNLFTGLINCAATGERMQRVHSLGRKGTTDRKRYVYLASARKTGVPWRAMSIDYQSFEEAIIDALRQQKAGELTGEGRHANGHESEVKRLAGRLVEIDDERTRIKSRRPITESLLDLLTALDDERERIAARMEELRQVETGRPSAVLGEAHGLIDMLAEAAPEKLPTLRRRLKMRLRTLIASIWVLVHPGGRGKSPRCADVQIYYRAGGVLSVRVYRPRRFDGVPPLPDETDLRRWRERTQQHNERP